MTVVSDSSFPVALSYSSGVPIMCVFYTLLVVLQTWHIVSCLFLLLLIVVVFSSSLCFLDLKYSLDTSFSSEISFLSCSPVS